MSDTNIIPISDEQAKAIQEAAKLGSDSLEVIKSFGGYVAWALGTTPQDLIGLLGGDWLRVKRVENMERAIRRAKERLEREAKAAEPLSLSVGVPLLGAAADEDREELVELWAALIAAAMDQAKGLRMRQRYIEAVRKMDPLDPWVLAEMSGANMAGHVLDRIATRLRRTHGEVYVSLENLGLIGVLGPVGTGQNAVRPSWDNCTLSPFGRELLEMLSPLDLPELPPSDRVPS